jgi:uncharacterized DUF497 family protein
VFEFHAAKSAANRDKHGIDFVEAQALWTDPRRLEAPARTVGETRFALIGRTGPRCWTVVFIATHILTFRLTIARINNEETEPSLMSIRSTSTFHGLSSTGSFLP